MSGALELSLLSQYCIERRVHCITLNYDDIFDEALWAHKRYTEVHEEDPFYWHPDGGYGFFCRPSSTTVQDGVSFLGARTMDTTSMVLLKLHGSINWRIRRGYSRPLVVDAIVHHQDWLTDADDPNPAILDHLDAEPFVIPPILTKGSSIHQPILRLLWARAFSALANAQRVVFLGYSMPHTDIATQYLFREAIPATAAIEVVNLTQGPSSDDEMMANYKRLFPTIGNDAFSFDGVVGWTRRSLVGALLCA